MSLESHYLGFSCIVIFLKLYVPSASLITTDTPLGKSGEYPSTTRKQCNTQAFFYSFKICIFTLTYSANKFLKIHKLLKTLNASFLITENAVAPAESPRATGSSPVSRGVFNVKMHSRCVPRERHPGEGVYLLSLFHRPVPGMSCQEASQGPRRLGARRRLSSAAALGLLHSVPATLASQRSDGC